MTLLLKAQGVSHRYGEKQVLEEVGLVLSPGEVVAALGPNGAGKTTLLRVLTGILRPTSGRVVLAGRDLARIPRRSIARALAVVPQEFSTAFPFSVQETVALGRAPHLNRFGGTSETDRSTVARCLEIFELAALAEQSFATLSGGEKQRVLLARALAQDCDLMLLDEPTAHMDLGHRLRTLEWLREWVAAAPDSRAALLISHDLVLAARYADRVVLLANGRCSAAGEPAQVLTEERILEVYGVDARVSSDARGSLSIEPRSSRNGFGFGYSLDLDGPD